MDNRDVATIFSRMADMLEIQGENPHRVLAYRRAAEAISTLGEPLSDMWQADALFSIPGVGKVLAAKIDELMRTGGLAAYDKLLDSQIADMKNVGDRRAGAITAAKFLQEFAEETPWVHLDIAGTDLDTEGRPFACKGATGYGVRTLVQLLE